MSSPPDPELRIAALDEIRQAALDRLFRADKSSGRREARKRRRKEPKEGDLVLPRRFSTDQYHGRKLEPRWDGPYCLADIAFRGRSGRLFDLYSGRMVQVRAPGLKKRCHLDDLKVFSPRRSKGEDKGVEIIKFLDQKGIKAQYGPISLDK